MISLGDIGGKRKPSRLTPVFPMERKVCGSLHTTGFVKHTFRAISRVGMVESTQGIILLGKMWRHVTFGNVYWEFDCVHT
jgi:hypothetical protein